MRLVFAVIAVILVLAGCSDSAKTAPVTASDGRSSLSTEPMPATYSPEPTDYGGAKLITGSEVWSVDAGDIKYHADGTSHSRHGTVHSTFKSTDPRVAGTGVGTWNSDRWGTLPDGAMVQWGRMRITNQGGAWVGRMSGIYTSQTYDRINYWLTGTGKYAGLSVYLWESPTSGAPDFPFTALVFRGAPPPR